MTGKGTTLDYALKRKPVRYPRQIGLYANLLSIVRSTQAPAGEAPTGASERLRDVFPLGGSPIGPPDALCEPQQRP